MKKFKGLKITLPSLPRRKPRIKSVQSKYTQPVQMSQATEETQTSLTWRSFARGLLMFSWTKIVLNWLIMVAGTMSELAFMIAALYLCINANVHKIVLLFIDEGVSQNLVNFATSAYVALPELILSLAVVTTLGHIKTYMYTKEKKALTWSLLFAAPTFIFFVLSLVTLSNAVTNTTFELPGWMVVFRADAGYMYAFASLLYLRIGKEQETDRLRKKDVSYQQLLSKSRSLTSRLRTEKESITAELLAENETLTAELNQLKAVLAQHKKQNDDLKNAINKSADSSLQAYSQECNEWLKLGIKTASYEEVERYTGHSKRKLTYAAINGKIQTAPRNKELILISSLIPWLKDNQPKVTDTEPKIQIVNE
jgi:hypothetical protein